MRPKASRSFWGSKGQVRTSRTPARMSSSRMLGSQELTTATMGIPLAFFSKNEATTEKRCGDS
jgi:hypothetical protein